MPLTGRGTTTPSAPTPAISIMPVVIMGIYNQRASGPLRKVIEVRDHLRVGLEPVGPGLLSNYKPLSTACSSPARNASVADLSLPLRPRAALNMSRALRAGWWW